MAINSRTYSFDANLVLADGQAMTADGFAQVGGADGVIDFGGRQGTTPAQQARTDAVCVIDVASLDIASSNEVYNVILLGSNDSSFATGTVQMLGAMQFGKGGSRYGVNMVDSTVGRYELMFSTEQNGVMYQYVKMYLDAGGTTPAFTIKAFCAVLPEP